MHATKIEAVFFDIGGTLGQMAADKFVAFESTCQLLTLMRRVLLLRLGIITNLPEGVTTVEIKQLLIDAKILKFFDPHGFITNLDARVAKPDPHIYRYAAEQMGLTPAQCLYVTDETQEIEGACAAGMASILKSAL